MKKMFELTRIFSGLGRNHARMRGCVGCYARAMTVWLWACSVLIAASSASAFNDEDWISMGGIPGTDAAVWTAVPDGHGNLYIGGNFIFAGDALVHRVAKWDGSEWFSLGTGMADGNVMALAVMNGEVFAGGRFTEAGEGSALHIAKWDGNGWSSLGSGLNGPVTALAAIGGDLYAGGQFTTAGGAPANHIAKWDGNSWHSLDSGLNNDVSALAVLDGALYAAGSFTTAGGILANRIAKWDGTSWSSVGAGMDNTVNALATMNGELYAGGLFRSAGGIPANRIAKWDGTSWSPLGFGMDDSVSAIAVMNGELYAGGRFRAIGGVPASGIAKWDGSSWTSLGHGSSSVLTLAALDGKLIAGGWGIDAGAVQAAHIASWNGTSWSALGADFNAEIRAFAVLDEYLYAAGSFTTVRGIEANRIARWDGNSWSPLGPGLNGDVHALEILNGDLYAGGYFRFAGEERIDYLAKWDGTEWSAVGSGVSGPVYALEEMGGELFVGGAFSNPSARIAKWDGSAWSDLGSQMDTSGSYVYALAGHGGELFMGGNFSEVGGIEAKNIAKWNGSSWSALGSGMDSQVQALLLHNGNLYAGGKFRSAGGIPAGGVAKWDDGRWSALGSDLRVWVSALAVHDDQFYVGGDFSAAAGAEANNVARWDGSNWAPLGSGVVGINRNDYVYALAIHKNELYAGGDFILAGDQPSAFLAKARIQSGAGLRREIYREVPGGHVSSLLISPKFPALPDQVDEITAFESSGLGENYGERITGFIVPNESGDYIFYLASDDRSQLWLSLDENPANRRLIATEPEWNGPREWTSGANQSSRGDPPVNVSQPVSLVAGQRYFVEALHKQAGMGDHLAVTWRKAGEPLPANGSDPIGGEFLELPEASTPAPVTFADAVLEAAVRASLKKAEGELTTADLAGLKTVEANWMGVTSLAGLESAYYLRTLNVAGGIIADLSPIRALRHLEMANLSFNQISDLGPMESLTGLRDVHLGNNRVRDLSPLAGLPNLEVIRAGFNRIIDVSPLAALPKLRHLELDYNRISALAPLAEIGPLRILFLGGNPVSDLGPLSGKTDLEVLSLRGTRIEDISALGGIISLRELHLNENRLVDVSALSGLQNLERLEIQNNYLDISPGSQARIVLDAIAGSAAVIYEPQSIPPEPVEPFWFTDFDSGMPPEITGYHVLDSVEEYAELGGFSGEFLRNHSGTQMTVLTLEGLPPHNSVDLGFLLAMMDSWDGNNEIHGPDHFVVRVDGMEIFNETIGWDAPTFVPDPRVRLAYDTDFGFTSSFKDAAYDMSQQRQFRGIPHTGGSLRVEFYASGPNTHGADDESWAIDNLSVSLRGEGLDPSPVEPLAVSGWNEDLVLENAPSASSASFDGGASVWFESGVGGHQDGFPQTRVIQSRFDPEVRFHLNPYDQPNALLLTETAPEGTLVLETPMSHSMLYLLAVSANGGGEGTVHLRFTDGSESPGISFFAPDWWDGTRHPAPRRPAIDGLARGRWNAPSMVHEPSPPGFSLHQTDINLDALGLGGKVLSEIVFTRPSGGSSSLRTAVFAVSSGPGSNGLAGKLRREIFRNIPGTSVRDLQNSPAFPGLPDQMDEITTLESANLGDNYGQRISGYLVPSESAEYVFYLASDDSAVFYLSTDEDPANKRRLAIEQAWNSPRQWTGGANQHSTVSEPVALLAGQRYYLEILHKEGQGGDHVAMTWRKIEDPVPVNGSEPIGPEHLELREPDFNPAIIPDANLAGAIRERLAKPAGEALTVEDLGNLYSLNAGGRGISSLSGLESAHNLRFLRLGDNQISDLTPLAGLVELRELLLHMNQITDLSPLSSLVRLTDLTLYGNAARSIEPLTPLVKMVHINLGGNPITDFSPMDDWADLRYLFIGDTGLQDIGFLARHSNLSILELRWNEIVDISPLAGLNQLQELLLNGNQIDDITVLEGLFNLDLPFSLTPQMSLHLENNQLDLSETAGSAEIIQNLLDRGVEVTFLPQAGGGLPIPEPPPYPFADGGIVGSTIHVSPSAEDWSPGHKSAPHLAYNGEVYLIVWQDERNLSSSGSDIYAARISRDGQVLDPGGIPISTAAGSQTLPEIAACDGVFLVVWKDGRNGLEAGEDIFAARVASDGTVLDPDGIPVTSDNSGQSYPSVASNGARWLVVWGDNKLEQTSADIWGAFIELDGALASAEPFIVNNAPSHQHVPSADSNGQDFFVAWHDYRNHPALDVDVYGTLVRADGSITAPEGVPIHSTISAQWFPSVASDGDGFLVLWHDHRAENVFLTNTDVYGAWIDSSGQLQSPEPFAVSRAHGNQRDAYAAFDGLNYVVVWTDSRSVDRNQDIFGASLTPGTVTETEGWPINRHLAIQDHPFIAHSGDGEFLVVHWAQEDEAGGYKIMANPLFTSPLAAASLDPAAVPGGSPELMLAVHGAGFLPGAVLLWDGTERQTTFISNEQLSAQIPAEDLVLADGIKTVLVRIRNPAGSLSNPLGFVISPPSAGDSQAVAALPGEEASASTAPSSPGQAGVSGTIQNNGGDTVSLTVANYSENPTGGGFSAGGGFTDVQVTGADSEDTATVHFYYPATLDPATEAALNLVYYDGAAWMPVRSDQDTGPVKNTQNDLDGTISGGRFSVVFSATSTPRITELGGTFFALVGNNAPVARDDLLIAVQNAPAEVSIRKILSNDSDPDGDSISFMGAVTPTEAGGTVSFGDGVLTYEPPAGHLGEDEIVYTISDGEGGSAQGRVHVEVEPASGADPLEVQFLDDGVEIQFIGIPLRNYAIQESTDLGSGIWETVAEIQAGANGMFTYLDELPEESAKFYRAIAP